MSRETAKRARRIVKKLTNSATPIAKEMVLPNTSGDHVKGIKRAAPTADADLANKKYVDDQDAAADAHITSNGSSHSDVAANSAHTAGDGSDHADVATNTAASHAESHTVASHSDKPWTIVEAGCTTVRALTSAAFTTIIFEVEHQDSLGEYDHTTGIFTASKAGTYAVSWAVMSAGGIAWAEDEVFYAALSKNNLSSEGNFWRGYYWIAPSAVSTHANSVGSAIVTLAATDTLRINVEHNQGANINTHTNEKGTFFHIARIA